MHPVNQVAFLWAQAKVEVAFIFRKAWQAVKIVNFLDGQDGQAAGFGRHTLRIFNECEKSTFCTASLSNFSPIPSLKLECKNFC
jgi:hypothetical protein